MRMGYPAEDSVLIQMPAPGRVGQVLVDLNLNKQLSHVSAQQWAS